MKILMLTPYLPYPLYSGGQIRTYNLLKNLAQKHEITLFSLIKTKEERKYISELEKFCRKVEVFKRSERPWTLKNILRTGFGFYPFLVVRNLSSEEKRAVAKKLKEEKFDLIHAETFYVMPNIPQTSVPILLVEQTIEFLVYQHFVETTSPLLRFFLSVDVLKIKFWEKHFWKKANKVVAMSEADNKIMRREVSNLDVAIIPNGVDIDFFSKVKREKGEERVLFVGNFKWLQNKEAVGVLVEKVWPKVIQKIKGASLSIVGRYPTPKIKSYAGKSITILENVKDIRKAYQAADLLLAPIFGPGGTRYKILEAMAAGLPVVTTPWGIEGLGARDGWEVIIREDPSGLAEAVVKILTDRVLYQKLAKAGKKFVEENYNWRIISSKLDRLYEEVSIKKPEL